MTRKSIDLDHDVTRFDRATVRKVRRMSTESDPTRGRSARAATLARKRARAAKRGRIG